MKDTRFWNSRQGFKFNNTNYYINYIDQNRKDAVFFIRIEDKNKKPLFSPVLSSEGTGILVLEKQKINVTLSRENWNYLKIKLTNTNS